MCAVKKTKIYSHILNNKVHVSIKDIVNLLWEDLDAVEGDEAKEYIKANIKAWEAYEENIKTKVYFANKNKRY